jgi:hypothetical protein
MSPEEVEAFVCANPGKMARLKWADGAVQAVLVDCADQEGFLHSGPNGKDPRHFWSRFGDVIFAEILDA